MKLIRKLLGSLAFSGAWVLAFSSEALAACPGGPDGPSVNVSRTFASGAKWSFDVQMTPCEGLMLSNVRYQPAFNPEMQVFARASLAEVHVPYDNNAARFLDVTDSTNGLGTHAITLSADECDGTRDLSNEICIEDEDHGYRWKYHESFAEMHSVAVFAASQLGEYTYINRWEFHEDGTIEPQVGLTGALQIISSNAAEQPHFGSSLGVEGQSAEIGLNHMHNFYYRLDFDIAGAANDVVQRINYAPSSLGAGCAGSACGRTSFTPVTTEARQTWSATGNTSWVIQDKSTLNSDGRRVGYEVKPHYSGTWRGKTDGTEPWAQHDLFVTRYVGCERYAVRNVSPRITGCAAATPENVFDMVNGEATDGQDVVVWFINRHHHVTRDEDQFNMPIEWTGFHISPRSFAAENPAP
jgi:primary-amine oxidase